MPQVVERLRKEFSMEPQLYDPDEAVAKGAALIGNNIRLRGLIDAKLQSRSRSLTLETASQAELRDAEKKVAEEQGYQLEIVSRATARAVNVSSKTFGIVVLDNFDDKGNPLLTVSNLIYRNTPRPAERKQTYATIAPNQRMVVVELMENMCDAPAEGMPEPIVPVSDSVSLWDGDLPIQPGLPIHSPIEVTFRIGEDGRLCLIAFDPASGGKLEKHLPEKSADYEQETRKVTERSRALVVE
jgi:molecular chaperone DnaK (HSP70)